jgi:hypothetical protein
MYHRLALRLVDGHCESEADRELTTGKRDVEVLIGRLNVHSGNEDNISSMFTRYPRCGTATHAA